MIDPIRRWTDDVRYGDSHDARVKVGDLRRLSEDAAQLGAALARANAVVNETALRLESREQDIADLRSALKAAQDGDHFCKTTEDEWRPCPAEFCEAGALVEQLGPGYHVFDSDEKGWAIKHPPACRDDMLSCPVHVAALDLYDPPVGPGRYRVELVDGLLSFQEAPT